MAVLGLMAGAAQAQETKTMAVSIPDRRPRLDRRRGVPRDGGSQGAGKEISGAEGDREDVARPAPRRPTRSRTSTTQGIDALVVLPHDPNVLTDPIRKVKDKGTFVTVVDRIADDRSIYDLYVGGDNPGLGASAAEST